MPAKRWSRRFVSQGLYSLRRALAAHPQLRASGGRGRTVGWLGRGSIGYEVAARARAVLLAWMS